jgi:PAS domain S-box-containing protein
MLFVFAVVACGSIVHVHLQGDRDALDQAARAARYAARAAANQVGREVADARATIAGLGGSPQIAKTIDHPKGCTLNYAGSGPGDKGHVDIVAADGRVVCTSRPDAKDRPGDYSGTSWFAQARRGPALIAPVRDAAAGTWVAVAAAPLPHGVGVVAAFVDLRNLGPALADRYGGGRSGDFTMTSGDGRTVLATSTNPGRWVGAVAASPFARSPGEVERRDLQGTLRIYQTVAVPSTGWRFHVGADEAAVLADARRLQTRQLLIILGGLIAMLTVALFTYRRVSKPIEQLSAAVRSSSAETPPAPVAVGGPAEVAVLGENVNGLIESVGRELRDRLDAQARERRLAAIVESSGDAIIGKTLDGTITSWNAGAERLYGYTAAEVLGRPISMLIHPDRPDELPMILQRLSRGESIEHYETTRVAKGGGERHVSLTISPIRDNGTIVGASTIARDITDHRRLEEQLRQSQKMEAIGSLAAGIAHDFNNILMVIQTCSSLALEQVEDEEVREDLLQIDAAAERAAELTHQLLAYSRQQVLRPEMTDLNEAVEETVGLVQRLIGEDVEISVDLADPAPSIVVDRSQLVQLILNLAVNARDAMPDGGTLMIRTSEVDLDANYVGRHVEVAPGRHALLQVVDSGVGMDEETRQRVFDPFFTTKEAGHGLGLATVYGVVKQSGGHIWLYSEPGIGTTFKIYLPSSGAGLPPAEAPRDIGSLEGRETILVVEDDDALRPLVGKILRSYGYTVLEADGASSALEIGAAHEAIDFLLTDVVMPGVNGRELAQRLMAERPSLKVLFTSGYPADRILRHGVSQVGSDYIEKPYRPDELARKIREILDTGTVGPLGG